jgi:hypothetical protein
LFAKLHIFLLKKYLYNPYERRKFMDKSNYKEVRQKTFYEIGEVVEKQMEARGLSFAKVAKILAPQIRLRYSTTENRIRRVIN